MGLCASSQIISRQNGRFFNFPYTIMIIQLNGNLQELKKPVIKAREILTQNPNCFICCSETMNVGSIPIPIAEDDELQAGQLYFLMPISKSQFPLTLQDLCTMAIKASKALNLSEDRSSPIFIDEKCSAVGGLWSMAAAAGGGGNWKLTNGGYNGGATPAS
ncbi:hypothetical protein M9H77_20331 [Catharanthus roseus]|uniref:Uncharacterized protein n=1 Tax=Catharanthus roseus TaxID=4058 RepID=A0ACC0AM26_CATRO|nr:hypothetical protein M9H77_20331 [Catharanthus roseus]